MSLTSTEQLTLQNKLVNKDRWEKELKQILNQKTKLETTRDLVKKQFELQVQNDAASISPEGFILLKPTWQFELDPAYMERHRQITEIGHKVKAIQFDASIAEHQTNIDKVTEQYDTLSKQLDSLNKEILEIEKKRDE